MDSACLHPREAIRPGSRLRQAGVPGRIPGGGVRESQARPCAQRSAGREAQDEAPGDANIPGSRRGTKPNPPDACPLISATIFWLGTKMPKEQPPRGPVRERLGRVSATMTVTGTLRRRIGARAVSLRSSTSIIWDERKALKRPRERTRTGSWGRAFPERQFMRIAATLTIPAIFAACAGPSHDFVAAIRDTGFACERINSSQQLDDSGSRWRVACMDAQTYLASIEHDGSICVSPIAYVEAPVTDIELEFEWPLQGTSDLRCTTPGAG